MPSGFLGMVMALSSDSVEASADSVGASTPGGSTTACGSGELNPKELLTEVAGAEPSN